MFLLRVLLDILYIDKIKVVVVVVVVMQFYFAGISVYSTL